jgi:hypothetical protein
MLTMVAAAAVSVAGKAFVRAVSIHIEAAADMIRFIIFMFLAPFRAEYILLTL